MANVLVQPVSGAIQFNNETCGSSTVPDLSSNGVKLFQVDDSGIQVESHFGGLTGGTRFSVAGDGGQLLSITDSLTGDIFSVNDASGLPIINVNSCIDDVVKVGSFNTNALVVSGTSVAIGTDKVISNQLSIAGKLSAADEIAATSLDISGNVDIDGTLETDALSLNGTTVTSTAAELNKLDGVTSTASELNCVDGLTSTTAELNTLDGFNGDVTDLNYAKTLYDTGVTGTEFNCLDGLTATTSELNKLDGVTSTATELNCVDGLTSTTAELNTLDGFNGNVNDLNYAKSLCDTGVTDTEFNCLDGLTSTTTELNKLDGYTGTASELNCVDGLTSTTAELNKLDGVTSSTAELNCVDGLTSTTAELNKLDGVTSSTAELNCVDGLTATTTELNYVDGVTSSIQTQLNAKGAGDITAVVAGTNLNGGATSGSATVNLDGNVTGLTCLVVDDITVNGSLISNAGQGHLCVCGGGDVVLDSSNGDIKLRDAGTDYGRFLDSSNNFIIQSLGNDKDIIFCGCDNGSAFTALTLDMSDGGSAAFNNFVSICNSSLKLGGTAVTSTAAELNKLDGVTSTATELNCVDGLTATTSELNKLDGVTSTTAELNCVDGLTATTSELNKLDGVTSTATELNCVDGLTSTTAELNTLDGFTGNCDDLNYAKTLRATGVTGTEFNCLDGLTATTTELNYVDGVTSSIQTQLNAKGAGDITGVTAGTNLNGGGSSGSVTVNLDSGLTGLTCVVVDDITLNGDTISTSGNAFIDAVGDITLDADGGEVILSDGGTNYGHLKGSTSDFIIQSLVSNEDIIFKGNDGGSVVTALTLDMSDAGSATFNNYVHIGNSKLSLNGTAVTSTAAELNKLDGVTSTATELNCVDGLTATTSELNKLDGVTSTATELNCVDGLTSTTAELNTLDGFNGDVTDLNYAKTLYDTGVTGTEFNCLDGLTATTSELNKLDGVTSSTAELNCVDGLTATTTELNYVDGVTSSIQTQLNSKGTGTVSSLSDLSITSTAAELNTLDGFNGDVTDLNYAKTLYDTGVTGTEFNCLDGLTSTTTELNCLDGLTSTTAELNKLDGFNGDVTDLNYAKTLYDTGVSGTEFNCLDGLTATTSELNKLDGVTSSTAELNCVDGLTATTTELNYVDGVTSNIQTQLNASCSCGAGTVTSVDDGNGLTGGAITTTGSLAVGAGTGITVNTNDVAVTAAQTGITSIKNTSLVVGRDDHNLIKFSTDNNIIFRTSNGDRGCIDDNGDFNISGHVCVSDGHDVCTDEVRARDGDGLTLSDDAGNGMFIKDGGNVAIGSTTANNKLQICAGTIELNDSSGYGIKFGSCSCVFNYGDLYVCQTGAGNIRLETSAANSDIDICVANASGSKYNIAKFDGSACVTDFTGMIRAEQQINAQTGTTYTFVLADHGKLVTSSNGSAQTLTVPPNSSVAYPIGADITLTQLGSGQVTIAAGSGVTLYAADSELKTRVQYSTAVLTKVASDSWLVAGDLTA